MGIGGIVKLLFDAGAVLKSPAMVAAVRSVQCELCTKISRKGETYGVAVIVDTLVYVANFVVDLAKARQAPLSYASWQLHFRITILGPEVDIVDGEVVAGDVGIAFESDHGAAVGDFLAVPVLLIHVWNIPI